jgi:hypothetical protein
MTILLILAALFVFIAVAEWRGWVADTRDGMDWVSRDEVSRRQSHA